MSNSIMRHICLQLRTCTYAFLIFCATSLIFSSCKKDITDASTAVGVQVSSDDSEDNYYVEKSLPVQKPVTKAMNADIGGYLEALPASYAQHPNKRYPLLLYLHGLGCTGNGTLDELLHMTGNAVPKLIKTSQFPANFTVNGKTFQFIVITPQFKDWPFSNDVNAALNYILKKYRVDSSRIYISGQSMGGGGAWDYAIDYGKRVTAIVPIAGASWPTQDKANKIAAAKVAVWAFHGELDPHVPDWYSINYVQYINNCNPAIPARLTLFPGDGHNAWTDATNPDYREKGKNIYEWMLSYSRKIN